MTLSVVFRFFNFFNYFFFEKKKKEKKKAEGRRERDAGRGTERDKRGPRDKILL